ncbi:3D (Asp-Asp-Asp) domain-containing protein [Listeria rocourtiae]|uniref:3D (Asp-Asp-Asp) domain-containing protein n=1 Tax=Listeria rocourtiae TaxID=647910 RepID=A0A4R6ZNG9_9LIST|nr:SPBc2 prophage-derived protein yorM [Listeria rocourtiae FSL F6-920]TDR53935.1 3D (Asp-Asp-Asp) domain-containing protein [Listeria rocourtiae]
MTPISTILTSLLLTAGLVVSPPAPSIEAQQLANQVAPHAQVWRAESDHQRQQITALKAQLAQKDAELIKLKRAEVKQTPKATPPPAKRIGNWQSGEFTAYYPANDAMQGGGITSKGDNLYQSLYFRGYRIIAAPPNVPFDTVVEIEVAGQTIKGIVRDRGGRIQGNKFDITYADKNSAEQFGRQQGKWRVIE